MVNKGLLSMYRMVCDAPQGAGISVERMPELIEQDIEMNTHSHTHAFYEILWFRESGGTHSVDFQDFPILANRIFFLMPGQVHHFDETRSQGYSIKICSEFCNSFSGENEELRYALFYANHLPYADLDADFAGEFERLVHQLEREQNLRNQAKHSEMLCLMVQMLLIFILRHTHHSDGLPNGLPTAQQNLYIRFRTMLEQRFVQLHLVAQYAELLGISTKTLTTAVRACTGRTPLEMIDERITLEAKRLLRFSDLKVKEIAFHLGFETPSNFIKFFQRHADALPSEYQQLK